MLSRCASRQISVLVTRRQYNSKCQFKFTSQYKQYNNARVSTTRYSPCAHQRFASSSAIGSTIPKTIPKQAEHNYLNYWRRVALFVKYTRIPLLILSVYQLGYQQGIIDYSRDPSEKEEALLDSILASVGCNDRTKLDICHSSDNGGRTSSSPSSSLLLLLPVLQIKKNKPVTRRVAAVGGKIIAMAQLFIKDELGKAVDQVTKELSPDVTDAQLYDLIRKDSNVQYWDKASRRLKSKTTNGWSFLLIDTPIANAFVTEILPNRIFITTAMFEHFIANDDELALVLGHEVSHLVLGHVSEANTMETMLRTLEVLLLSLDPTEGLLSLALVGSLATFRTALTAAHSRENENQADELGIKLAAMACYDTKKASEVFRKMHQHEQHQHQHQHDQGGNGEDGPTTNHTTEQEEELKNKNNARTRRQASFLDTHPPIEGRYEDLLTMATERENVERYKDTTCASVKTRMRYIWKKQ